MLGHKYPALSPSKNKNLWWACYLISILHIVIARLTRGLGRALVSTLILLPQYLLDVPLTEYQQAHPSIEADIYDYLKPENCVSRRVSYGSTGQAAVKEQLKVIKSKNKE